MNMSDKLTLVKLTYENDEYGIQRATEKTREIFCNVSSISAQEYYTAAQTGNRPQYRFIIWAKEYDNEKLVRYAGQDLTVYRPFMRSKNMLELYTERKQGNNGGQ